MSTFTTETIDQFLESLKSNGSPPNTVKAYRADLMEFLKWGQTHRSLMTDSNRAVQSYVTEHRQQWAPRTTKRKVASLRSFGRWNGTPLLEGYRVPRPDKGVPHPIPEGINGVLEMIQECESERDPIEARAYIALCGLCGLRSEEARRVTVECINPYEMTLTVRGKGDKTRVVPIGAVAWRFIMPAVNAKPQTSDPWLVHMADRTVRAMVTRLGQKAALSRPIKSHDLRATFATAAYAKTNNLRAVQELLGHADSATTEIYTGISMGAMRDAVEIV